jgi:hypothetical protein
MATYVAAKKADDTANSKDLIGGLRAGWHAHIEFGLANPEVFLLLNAPHRIGRSPAVHAGEAVLRERVHRLAAAGMLCLDEARAVALILAAGTGVIVTLLAVPVAQRDPGLADAMFDAMLATLSSGGPQRVDSEASSIARAFAAVVPELPGLSPNERSLMAEWVSRATRS